MSDPQPAPGKIPEACPICTMPMDDIDGGCVRHEPSEIITTLRGRLTGLIAVATDFAQCYTIGTHGPGQMPPGVTANACLARLNGFLDGLAQPTPAAGQATSEWETIATIADILGAPTEVQDAPSLLKWLTERTEKDTGWLKSQIAAAERDLSESGDLPPRAERGGESRPCVRCGCSVPYYGRGVPVCIKCEDSRAEPPTADAKEGEA